MIHWHHPALYVAKSKIKGLKEGCFTKKAINKHELIWYAEDYPVVTLAQSIMLSKVNPLYGHGMQVAKDLYYSILPDFEDSPVEAMNHSCSPNVVYLGTNVLMAWKNIPKGGELYYDYGTAETKGILPRHSVIIPDCKCGSRNCRKNIRSDDYKKLVKVYGIYMQKFILKELKFKSQYVQEYFYD
jgi:hypothetical protein